MRAPVLTASLFSLLLGTSALAQTSAEPQTLFNRASDARAPVTGWFVAPTFDTTGFAGGWAYGYGIRGGIYLQRRFAVGVVANALATDQTSFSSDGVRNFGSYGGLLFQYVLESNRVLHASLETTIGSGRWCHVIDDAHDGCAGKTFGVFEPGANAELNVARHVRLTAGVGYRLAVARGEGPSTSDLSNFVVRTGIVFGSF
jgi:hypothetical protein